MNSDISWPFVCFRGFSTDVLVRFQVLSSDLLHEVAEGVHSL